MKTTLTRTLAIFIALLLLLSFAACAGNGEKEKPTAQTTAAGTESHGDDSSEEISYEPSRLPEGLNYGGATIRILCHDSNEKEYEEDGAMMDNYHAGEICVDELMNEPVNDAVYNRERYVEDLLNVEIKRIQTPDREYVDTYAYKCTMSGDSACEIVATDCRGPKINTQAYVYRDLYEVDNLNFSAPWWSQDYEQAASVGGRLYCATGSMSLTTYRMLYVIFFNKQMAENNGITDVYETVFNGGWTLDYLTEVSSGVYIDVNGNSQTDEEDTFGFMIAPEDTDTLWSSFEISILSKDEEDYFVYSPDFEKFGNAHDRLLKLFNAKSTSVSPWVNDGQYKLFAADHALFATSYLLRAENEVLRNMQSEYGILPMIKYDEKQKEYRTMPHDNYATFAIPSVLSEQEADMAGAVLEAMSWYSYRYVVPAYFNVAMKGKYANDSETRRMLDLIDESITMNSAWIYSDYLADYPQKWRYLVSDREENFMSIFAGMDRKIKILIKDLNQVMEKLSENI